MITIMITIMIIYYNTLYYTILYHTILYHTIPYHTVPCYADDLLVALGEVEHGLPEYACM